MSRTVCFPTDTTPYSGGIKLAIIVMFCVIPMVAWAATLLAMSNLLGLVVNSDTPEIYDGKFKSLSDEKAALQQKLDSMTKQAEADSRSQKQLEKLLGEITESEVQLTDYNDEFIRRVVEQVTVLSATQIEVRFVGGYSKVGCIE